MSELTFEEYIEALKDHIDGLKKYNRMTGRKSKAPLKRISRALGHKDPFVVLKASIAAHAALSDQSIYH